MDIVLSAVLSGCVAKIRQWPSRANFLRLRIAGMAGSEETKGS